jgi:pyruvate dehydrogenase E2 component (dihydrolipoamide acetyltransferase)
MPYYFAMPKLGMDMTEGRIAAWLADEGSWIKAGQPLLEIETDKATNELEAPVSAKLARIVHPAGDQVACGTIIAVFLDENEAMPAVIPQSLAENETATSEAVEAHEPQMQKQDLAPAPGQRISIAPSARKLADELGVDLAEVEFTGGHISRADVQRAFESRKTQLVSPELERIVKPLLGIRKVTAERMLASVSATARVALNISIDAGALMDRREASNPKVSYNVLIAKAVSIALSKYPYMNAHLSGDEI